LIQSELGDRSLPVAIKNPDITRTRQQLFTQLSIASTAGQARQGKERKGKERKGKRLADALMTRRKMAGVGLGKGLPDSFFGSYREEGN
jgi:hypothetical protein